jgi:sec-independent protein translocase protein TatA
MPFGLHPGFLVVLMVVVLVVFGPGKLPELGNAAGNAIREFRRTTAAITDGTGEGATEEKGSD